MVDSDVEGADLGPGLHVLKDAAPLAEAGRMASRLGADLCTTLREADDTLAGRRELPVVDSDSLESLRTLARSVAVADRIARRTQERATAEVADRMTATGTGMAVHPSTIRDRAAAVEDARATLLQADQLVEASDAVEVEDPPTPIAPVAPAPAPAPPPAPPPDPPSRPRGLFRRRRQPEVEDTRESSDLLRSMAAATDEAFGARRASAAREDQRALLVARRDAAAELVRVTERAWRNLAGEGVDPADVEDVIRRLDPQHQDAVLIARETVGVRTASAVLDQLMARWQASWANLGLDCPAPEEAVDFVDRLAGPITRAIVLVGDATVRGLDVAEASPSAAVVVIEGLVDTSG